MRKVAIRTIFASPFLKEITRGICFIFLRLFGLCGFGLRFTFRFSLCLRLPLWVGYGIRDFSFVVRKVTCALTMVETFMA